MASAPPKLRRASVHPLDDSLFVQFVDECRQRGLDPLAAMRADPDLMAELLSWEAQRRTAQVPPPWDATDWDGWLYLGGRGTGKTRSVVEYICRVVRDHGVRRLAVAALTLDDVRRTLLYGPAGFGSPGTYRPTIETLPFRLVWPNGAVADVLTSVKPEQGRGPGYELIGCDELALWTRKDATGATLYDNLVGTAREGPQPRILAATTPRPTKLIKGLVADPRWRVVRETMAHNARNLPQSYLDRMARMYRPGTRMHRQEILGQVVEDIEGALWTMAMMDAAHTLPEGVAGAADLARLCERTVVAIDPASTSKQPGPGQKGSDETGIAVVGRISGTAWAEAEPEYEAERGPMYAVLAIDGVREKPDAWARRAVNLGRRYGARRIVVEDNTARELLTSLLHLVSGDEFLIEPLNAKLSKYNRADPVAGVYAAQRVKHAPEVDAESEDQMTSFPVEADHDDRVDALVHGVSALMRPLSAVRRVEGSAAGAARQGRAASPERADPFAVLMGEAWP